MYTDVRPCEQCGAEVRLEPREPASAPSDEPVGPEDGVVGSGDPTVDRRVCSNDACPTHQPGARAEP